MSEQNLNVNLRLKDQTSKELDKTQTKFKKFSDSLAKQWIGIGVAIYGTINAVKSVINAYAEQEDAVNRLNNALKIQGTFTEDLSRKYQTLAAELQKNTRYGDEAIMQLMQTLISVGNVTEKEMDRAVRVSLDFAAATGRDLKTAALTTAKAAAGFTGELSRYGIIIDQNIPQTKKFEAALAYMEKRFGGMALQDVTTMSGRMAQFKNVVGDLQEEVGKFIIKGLNLDYVFKFWSEKLRLVNTEITNGTSPAILSFTRQIEEADTRLWYHTQSLDKAIKKYGEGSEQVEKYHTLIQRETDLIAGLRQQMEAYNLTKQESIDIGNIDVNMGDQRLVMLQEQLAQEIETTLIAEQEKVEKSRLLWNMYRNEQTSAYMAQLQKEQEFFQVAIDNKKKADMSYWVLANQQKDVFGAGISKMFGDMMKGTFEAKASFKELGIAMVKTVIEFMVQKTLAHVMSKIMTTATVAVSSAAGAAVAAAWAPAAAMVSLATLGANAAPAGAGITSINALARSLAIPAMADGGIVDKPTIALIGERGREAVIPLSRGGGVGGNNITIEMYNPVITSDEVANDVVNKIIEQVSYVLNRESERA
ncbi:MAG: hypothetical protein M0P69_04435 [Bacteroidales bacterium]|nr:hypothetical protein [Bacteroidales bacterium]